MSIVMGLLVAQQVDPQTGRHLSPLRDFVTLTLSADRRTYYLGERMRLSLTFRNVSDRDVRGHFAVRPGFGPTRVLYRSESGEFKELNCFPHSRGRVGLKRHTLVAGEEMRQDVDVSLATLEPLTLLFDELKRFDVRVVFEDVPEDANARLESNVVSVDIIDAPTEEGEARLAYTPMLAYLAQVADGPDAFVTPESMAEAATFIDRYPHSRYTGPVKEGLLKWLQYRHQTSRATNEELALREKLLRAADTTAPELHAEASPSTLWPPNHKLVPVQIALDVSDQEDPSPVVKLVSVTCDDDCDGAQDIAGAEIGTDDRDFQLRAKRTGRGEGRTYTITYSATDASGNEAQAVATVVVPHDRGKK